MRMVHLDDQGTEKDLDAPSVNNLDDSEDQLEFKQSIDAEADAANRAAARADHYFSDECGMIGCQALAVINWRSK